jgi:rRNA processing protein Krr1/Pno1
VEWLTAKCLEFVEQEKVDEKERGFTLEFDFPQQFANHLIGKRGSNIRDLRDKFDVEIQVNDGKVQLKGPKAKAEAAKTHITALARQLQDEATHVLKVDPKFHRELIGAQGSQINKLQTRYKVHIFFPRNNNKSAKDDESVSGSSDAGKGRRQQAADEVIVRGPKRGADEARDEILSLLQYLKDTGFTATVTVQKKQLPSLIGSGGAALEQLRQATGARIDVPGAKEATEDQVDIQIKGTKTQVAAAKKILEEKRAVFDDTVVKKIEVPRKYHKSLIGTGGKFISRDACWMMTNGSSGATLRDIVLTAGGSDDQREMARTIQFPKQDVDSDIIKVEGRSDVVNKIVARIEAMVAERESQVTEAVEVAAEKHRSLVGRGGETKKKLEAEFNVSIDIPRQGSSQTDVKISGQPADVEKAKAHIETLVKDQPGETVQVPRALHHAISNRGQIFRKFKNDFNVTVDHAGETLPPRPAAPTSARAAGGALPLITDEEDSSADVHSWKVVEQTSTEEGDIPWVLRGQADNIEKVKKAIQSAIDQASKQTATGYLVLPDPRTYRFVIGQGGSTVNAIRKQTGCKITVPRDQAQGEAIEVVGTKEGVEKAKEAILEAVREGASGSSRPVRE